MPRPLQSRACWLLLLIAYLLGPLSSWSQNPQTTGENSVPPSSVTASPNQDAHYEPITSEQRWKWLFVHTVGPRSLAVGTLSAAYGTAIDKPEEYGPHWEGFSKRYGMRFTGVATGNAMEAGFGSLWGEDPRYFRTSGKPLSQRVRNVIVMTFVARRRDGHFAPAYARIIATPGNNFLSNTWRADSEATVNSALVRTLIGFGGRMAENAYQEFRPTFRHHNSSN
jgi:hypothetical protein